MGSLEQIERVTDLRAWPGDFPLSHLYTMGVAGERFLREIKDKGRFLGARCQECAYTYLPPSLFCSRCFRRLDDWREVGPAGGVEGLPPRGVGPGRRPPGGAAGGGPRPPA